MSSIYSTATRTCATTTTITGVIITTRDDDSATSSIDPLPATTSWATIKDTTSTTAGCLLPPHLLALPPKPFPTWNENTQFPWLYKLTPALVKRLKHPSMHPLPDFCGERIRALWGAHILPFIFKVDYLWLAFRRNSRLQNSVCASVEALRMPHFKLELVFEAWKGFLLRLESFWWNNNKKNV